MKFTKIFILFTTALFWVSCASYAQTEISPNEKQRWLKKNVQIVDNLESDNLDFAQFHALKGAIGNRKVVLLGEQTHGDGTTFEAKVRLIKFLHKEMGFETLVFESDFYQGFKVWSELKKGIDYRQVVPEGIHPRWARVKQIQPVFSYVQKSIGTKSELKMVGMDLLMGASYSKSSLIVDLEQFLNRSHPNLVKNDNFIGTKKLLRKILDSSAFLPTKSDQTDLFKTLDRYIAQLETKTTSKHKWNTDSFWAQVLRNLKTNLINGWSRLDGTYSRPVFFSRRDEMMADNIKWLSKRNSKIIIWASVSHNMRNFDAKLLKAMGWSSDTKFMGEYLSDLIGSDNMFHIAFTGYEGSYPDIYKNNEQRKFNTPSDESIEASLNRACIKYGYLLLNDTNSPAWLKKPFKASFIFNKEYLSDWSKSIDALFFTKKMEPSTYQK